MPHTDKPVARANMDKIRAVSRISENRKVNKAKGMRLTGAKYGSKVRP
jgi:hypothetical protein